MAHIGPAVAVASCHLLARSVEAVVVPVEGNYITPRWMTCRVVMFVAVERTAVGHIDHTRVAVLVGAGIVVAGVAGI